LELSIISQDRNILGSFDLIEIDLKDKCQILGWSCHLMKGDPFRVLGKYDSPGTATNVLDKIMSRENSLRNQTMVSNVFKMPDADGRD
jgi:hypothetical protein